MDFPHEEFPQGTAVMVDWPRMNLSFEGTVEGYHRGDHNQAYVIVKFVKTTHQKTLDRLKWYKYSTFLIKYKDWDLEEITTFTSNRKAIIKKI